MPDIRVLDSTMYYRETGDGAAMVFLHGNPTSSYLWRNVLPAIGSGRLLAPDLIGMGESGKPDIAYSYADQARYLGAWFDALELDSVILIGHDWGGSLAFDWASRNPGRVRGIAFTEAIVKPMTWAEFPPPAAEMFRAIKTEGVGENIVLNENSFIEQGLAQMVVGGLSEADLDVYRKPYPTPDSRRPILAWARANPIDGDPADVVARVTAFDEWLAASTDIPKLMLTFDAAPGTTFGPELIAWCTDTIAALDIAKLGRAGHHTPEDQPEAIAAAVTDWADRHHLR